jgi:glycosyltransferase involved in cell wall biosynthesis
MHNSFDMKTNLYALADGVIAISSGVADQLERRPWFARTPVAMILNGYGGAWTSLGAAASRHLVGQPILCVAGLYKRKGIDTLIKAFSRLASSMPSVSLYIVGDGPERRRLTRLASRQACADRIVFLGFQADIQGLMQQAALLALPSRAEPFGLVLLEARRMGLPIVASAIGGIPDVLSYGVAGMLVEPNNVIQLARALELSLHSSIRPVALADLPRDFSIERQRIETDLTYKEAINRRMFV